MWAVDNLSISSPGHLTVRHAMLEVSVVRRAGGRKAVKRGDGTYRDSDFTVVSLAGQTRDVPEPSAALASLGLLVGAAIFGLRRKH